MRIPVCPGRASSDRIGDGACSGTGASVARAYGTGTSMPRPSATVITSCASTLSGPREDVVRVAVQDHAAKRTDRHFLLSNVRSRTVNIVATL